MEVWQVEGKKAENQTRKIKHDGNKHEAHCKVEETAPVIIST